MYKCSFPECTHVAAYAILNSHAKTHGFNKVSEMTKAHGPIKHMAPTSNQSFHAKHTTVDIRESSFNNIETAMSRLKKKDRNELSVREG